MGQLGSVLARFRVGDAGSRYRSLGVSWGSSTLLDRILDLLTIFRRPVPVPVRTRKGLR